jgi:hypothetical protein
MSLDKPLDLEFINKGAYGIIMKQNIHVVHPFELLS